MMNRRVIEGTGLAKAPPVTGDLTGQSLNRCVATCILTVQSRYSHSEGLAVTQKDWQSLTATAQLLCTDCATTVQ